MQTQIILDLVEGDNGPDLPVRFKGLDLADYSVITMYVRKDDGKLLARTVEPDIADSELGKVGWLPGDLTRGRHFAEFEFIQIADGKKFTLPRKSAIVLDVRSDLG